MSGKSKSTIREVLQAIEELKSMSDLPVEKYASEDGLAYAVVTSFDKDDLKMTQLYKVFYEMRNLSKRVKQGRDFRRDQLLKLKPLVAYAAGRGVIPSEFYELVSKVLDRIHTRADMERAVDFLEAIVAYHKYHWRTRRGIS